MNKNVFEEAIDEVETAYGCISFFRNDQFLGRSLREYGEWAKKELDFLASLVDPGSVIIDAGAFIGTHTLAFSRFVGPEGAVYSFEPHPTYFKLLQRNTKNNQLANVHLFNNGLSDQPGEMGVDDISIYETNSFGSVKLTNKISKDDKLTVKIINIDNLGLESCSLIKADVEGMENLVLAGGRITIEQFKPFVYAECNSADAAWPVVQMMRTFGYKIYLYSETAYNTDNYLKNPVNIFGIARELALVCVPIKKDATFREKLNHSLDVVRINRLDDLVLALIKKPQYKEEVLASASGIKEWGNSFWNNEGELEQINVHIGRLDETNKQLGFEANQLKAEAQKQIESLTEWATSADAYGKSLAKELDKVREAYAAESTARDNEQDEAIAKGESFASELAAELEKVRADTVQDMAARDEAIAKGESFASELAAELEKVRADAAVEVTARDSIIRKKNEYITVLQDKISELQHSLDKSEHAHQQMKDMVDTLSGELKELNALTCVRVYHFFKKRKG